MYQRYPHMVTNNCPNVLSYKRSFVW